MRRILPLAALAAALFYMGTAPDWRDQSTQTIDVALVFYSSTGTVRTGTAWRAYIAGADTSDIENQIDFTYSADDLAWHASTTRTGVKIRSGWYDIYEIDGVDSLKIDQHFIAGYGLAKYAVDSDTTVATGAINARTIAAGAVGTSEVADGTIITDDISDGTLLLADLSSDSVDSTKAVTLSPTNLVADGAATGQYLVWNATKWDSKYHVETWRTKPQLLYEATFLPAAIATVGFPTWSGAAISAGTFAAGTSTASHPGVIAFSSSGTANSGNKVQSDITAFLIAGGECFSAIFQAQTTTNVTIRFGFHDATTITAPVDGCWINIAGTTLDGRTSSNSTTSTTSSSYTISATTWYRIEVVVNGDATSVAFACYNDSGTSLWSNTLATNIPTGAGRFCGSGGIWTESAGGSVGLVNLDWMAQWQSGRVLTR